MVPETQAFNSTAGSREQAGLVFSSIFDDGDGDEEICLQTNMSHPIAYPASTDPDTMYMDQAMLQPDRIQLLKAMADEVNAHTQNGHWRLILRSEVPPGIKVLPSVWAMKRKGQIATREVYKWKDCLNLHGGKQGYGVNYWETYAAMLAWPPIHFLMTLSIIKSWHTWQIDFTFTYSQADVECDLYMDIQRGFQVGNGNNNIIYKS
jgi:Reverse transcriptase (RNA-dependent DNA polymerase)